MEHIASILRNLQIDKEKWMREDKVFEDYQYDSGISETSVRDHYHDCDCGAWVCNDEACEELLDISPSGRAGFRECPMCEERG